MSNIFPVKGILSLLVICGLSAAWSTPALFYELGAELAYPIREEIVTGFMMIITNITACLIYLQLYIFPGIGNYFISILFLFIIETFL